MNDDSLSLNQVNTILDKLQRKKEVLEAVSYIFFYFLSCITTKYIFSPH